MKISKSGQEILDDAIKICIATGEYKAEKVNAIFDDIMYCISKYNKYIDREDKQPKLNPAVPAEESIQHEYLICLEDGGKVRSLKRYLKARYNLTPDQYRKKWGLPDDYPMTCPQYAERRSEIARNTGLGHKK